MTAWRSRRAAISGAGWIICRCHLFRAPYSCVRSASWNKGAFAIPFDDLHNYYIHTGNSRESRLYSVDSMYNARMQFKANRCNARLASMCMQHMQRSWPICITGVLSTNSVQTKGCIHTHIPSTHTHTHTHSTFVSHLYSRNAHRADLSPRACRHACSLGHAPTRPSMYMHIPCRPLYQCSRSMLCICRGRV